jgi:hypothetical protein
MREENLQNYLASDYSCLNINISVLSFTAVNFACKIAVSVNLTKKSNSPHYVTRTTL